MLTDYIPANVRKVIYTILATLFAVEGVLDASGVGLVPEKVEEVVFGLAAVFGFVLARQNTTDVTVVSEGE